MDKASGDADTDYRKSLSARSFTAFLSACLAIWLAVKPYGGITLDAQLYALQVMAALHPDPLAGDLFLRYGSQNDFTFFPQVTAAFVGRFGLEPTAAGVTFTCAILLLVVGWLLARKHSTSRLASLAVGLLIVIPGWYGAGEVLRYDEMYLSARLPAEVLALFSVLAALSRRWWICAILALCAFAMHPLMAAPACALAAFLGLDAAFPNRKAPSASTLAALAGSAGILAAAWIIAPVSDAQHASWIGLLQTRAGFLFAGQWRIADWLQNLLGLATLAVAADALRGSPFARVAYLAILVGLAGLLLAFAASFGANFESLLLVQPWRVLWLTRFMAIVLLPATLATVWRSGPTGRACCTILISGWVLYGFLGGAAAMAATAIWFWRSKLPISTQSLLLRGSWLVAIITTIVMIAACAQAFPLALDTNRAPGWVQRVVNIAGLAGPSALLMVVIWYGAFQARSPLIHLALIAFSGTLVAGLAPYSWAGWTDVTYTQARRDSFADWRRLIPKSAEVLWHEEPVSVWILLERRSYLSGSQFAGILYSRNALQEFGRRGRSLAPLASPGWWTRAQGTAADAPKPLTVPILRKVCTDPALGFVVDSHDLGTYAANSEWPTRGQHVYLYDCAAFRQETKR